MNWTGVDELPKLHSFIQRIRLQQLWIKIQFILTHGLGRYHHLRYHTIVIVTQLWQLSPVSRGHVVAVAVSIPDEVNF
jgi:hypothetical protein